MDFALPRGWKREEIIRRSGLSAGKIDVYYYSPTGRKFRTKPQLARYLGDTVDLSSFDYRTGRINASLLRFSKGKRSQRSHQDYRNLRNDPSLIAPIRQTASIFKQPVTVVKTQPDSKSKSDVKQPQGEKPKQVFWEKRLQSLRASNGIDNDEDIENFALPTNIKAIGPNLNDETALRSISTALHVNSQSAIIGQANAAVEKNPGVFINPEQPLVGTLTITDDDIRLQEEKVRLARKQLQQAITESL